MPKSPPNPPSSGHRGRRLLLSVLALAALLGVTITCGNKKPPKPPPSRIPATTSDLTVLQRGTELLLGLTYPSTTMGGLAIEDFEAIEFWELTRILPTFLLEPDEEAKESVEEVAAEGAATESLEGDEEAASATAEASNEAAPQGAEEPFQSLMFRLPVAEKETAEESPEQSVEALVPVQSQEFADQAQLLRTFQGEELESAVSGNRLILRHRLREIPTEENVAHIYAIKTRAGRHRVSAFSNLAKIIPRQPPPPLSSLEVTARSAGVQISWAGEEPALGFHVYRRGAQSREYGEPIFRAPAEFESYFDTGALYGSRYIYTVTRISSRQPLIESAIVAEYEIDYQDRFPPPTPRNLVALAEDGRVRLLWEPTTADDLAGYRIRRREAGGELQPIHSDPLVGQEYLDRGVVSGRTYGYSIVAVDRKGNRSQPSEEIEVRVP